MPALLLSTLMPLFLSSSSVSLSYFILIVPMDECLGKHSCKSSPFPIATLNGTFFFCSVKAMNNWKQNTIKQILLLLLLLLLLLIEFKCFCWILELSLNFRAFIGFHWVDVQSTPQDQKWVNAVAELLHESDLVLNSILTGLSSNSVPKTISKWATLAQFLSNLHRIKQRFKN